MLRQVHIHTSGQLVPEPIPSEVEIVVAELKIYCPHSGNATSN
jgi:hypothetical protein